MSKDVQRYLGTKSVLTDLSQKMQEYVLERSDKELGVHDSKVVELFNDFLLFLNDGNELPMEVLDPTNPESLNEEKA